MNIFTMVVEGDAAGMASGWAQLFDVLWAMVMQLVSSPAAALLILVLNAFCYTMERSPLSVKATALAVWLSAFVGPVLYYFYCSPASVVPTFPNPGVVVASNGFVLSVLAVFVVHPQVVKRWLLPKDAPPTPPPTV